MATAPERVERPSPRLDFTELVEERTQDFTGREWVFEAVHEWRSGAGGAARTRAVTADDATDSGAAEAAGVARPGATPADNESRMFLLTGGPGTGKTAIAARLVQMHLGKVAPSGQPAIAPGDLTYYHFCQAGLDSTLSPVTFVQSLAEALATRFPTYRRLLTQLGSQQFVVNADVHVNNVAAGATVIGAQVRIEILSSDARPLFDLMVRRPLRDLCVIEPGVSLLILVDSLDEALSFNPETNIAQLLRLIDDLPLQVRFIATCRSNSTVIFDLVSPRALDLITDAPEGKDEVESYASTRLKDVPEPDRTEASRRVAAASNGNFLYAFHVLNDLLRAGVQSLRSEALDLPNTLEDVYRQFLRRQLAANPTRWSDVYRPILGLIAVARGEGLSKDKLVGITGLAEDVAKDVLDTCAEYLVGSEKGRTYRIYHQSFRDFLLTDAKFGVAPAERHAAIAEYLEGQYGANWGSCTDLYALRYVALHWADAAALSKAKRESRTQSLVMLTQNSRYQRAFERRIGEMAVLKDYLHRAVQIAASNERVEMLPWIIKASLGLVAFHRDYLQAEAVVKLAEGGELQEAGARLKLFGDLDEGWQSAARLILAWLAIERSPDDARKVELQARQADISDATLHRLLERLAAALAGVTECPVIRVSGASLNLARAVVRRISGEDFDRELLFSPVNPSLLLPGTTPGGERGYAAQEDAPVLVSFALSAAGKGTALLDRYLDAHAGYNYVEYRNRSLWYVLGAVLSLHPSQSWVKDRLRRILVAALTGGAPDYRELLAFTAEVLQERAYSEESRNALDGLRGIATRSANELEHKSGANDTWAFHKRRLAGVMELFTLCAQDRVAADELLQEIRALPGGFAGFQAPAYLCVADGLRACRLERNGALDEMLGTAVKVAHNIQDYHFCARVTARCNTMRRWHSKNLVGQALRDAIEQLAGQTASLEFAADHVVGEAYQHRQERGGEVLSIAYARDAGTLDALAEVFQRPVVEFRRLNQTYAVSESIAPGTAINVPDPGLAPLLAVHFAARVLSDDSLEDERAGLIRQLVPVASVNPTALDAVLSYLLIASQPEDVGLINKIVEEVGPVTFGDVPVPLAQIGPHAVIPS